MRQRKLTIQDLAVAADGRDLYACAVLWVHSPSSWSLEAVSVMAATPELAKQSARTFAQQKRPGVAHYVSVSKIAPSVSSAIHLTRRPDPNERHDTASIPLLDPNSFK